MSSAPTVPSAKPSHASRLRLRFHATPRIRLGTVIKSLLTTLCGGTMLLTAAAVLDPATLQAGEPRATAPRSAAVARDAHHELLRSITTLISQCEQVLAVRARNDDRGCEAILWFEDTHHLNIINADELALIRHSPLFQTITVYTASKSASRFSAIADRSATIENPSLKTDNLSFEEVTAPGFIDRWRAETSVQAKVIATGLSDVRIETLNDRKVQTSKRPKHTQTLTATRASHVDVSTLGGGRWGADVSDLSNPLGVLRVHLTWASDSVDGSNEASAVVAAPHAGRPSPSQQQEYTP